MYARNCPSRTTFNTSPVYHDFCCEQDWQQKSFVQVRLNLECVQEKGKSEFKLKHIWDIFVRWFTSLTGKEISRINTM